MAPHCKVNIKTQLSCSNSLSYFLCCLLKTFQFPSLYVVQKFHRLKIFLQVLYVISVTISLLRLYQSYLKLLNTRHSTVQIYTFICKTKKEPRCVQETHISGRWVLMTKSGLEFLYTNRELVCSHCHWPSLVWKRYAIMPEAPVFRTATHTQSHAVL